MTDISNSLGTHNNKDVIWIRFNYDPDLNKEINTELSLSDLKSADIAMTGNSKDGYKFGLENIVTY